MPDTTPSPLVLAENKLDDATHKWLDEAVLSDSGEPTNLPMARYLLMNIIQMSEGTLGPKHAAYATARALLEQHEKLLGMLQVAWRKKSFRDIRNLEILRPPRHPPPRNRTARIHSYTEKQAVLDAWGRPYNGGHHQLLLQNINKMLRGMPYSNTVAIIQSSGSGKSRLVHEQSNLVFTLPFNLRLDEESKQMAYPPPDQTIRDYILGRRHTFPESQARCLQFLAHLFSIVSRNLDESVELLKEKRQKYASLAERWRAYMEEGDNRTRLYGLAVSMCREKDLPGWLEKYPPPERGARPANVYAASEEAKSRLEHLLKQISDNDVVPAEAESKNVKLMFYFDEAHVLSSTTVVDDPDRKDMYDVLRSCLNFFTSFPIFAIFLSTNSKIDQPAPPGSLAKSARMLAHSDALQAPITETPFDCSPDIDIIPGEMKLDDLSRIEFMARFGRPLFWTLLGDKHPSPMLPLMMNFARSKLICHSNIRMPLQHMSPSAVTAILDVLLSLDYEPSREAAKARQEEMVASHMRTAYSVPSDRAYVHSGYPSEPILAEAAAQQMNELQSQNPDANVMAQLLQQQFSDGLINRGLRGELVWRQLVTEAYLRAIRTEQQTGYNFSKGCGLITFIKELFSETCAEQILNSVPDNVVSTTKFAEAFKHARLRFTHWGRMSDDTGLTSHALLAAFTRGMAVIGWSSQERADMGFPVDLYPDGPLGASHMTTLMMQINTEREAGSVAKYSFDQQVVGLFMDSEDGDFLRPYITLVAELGVQVRKSPGAVTEDKVGAQLASGGRGTAMQTPAKPAQAKSSQTTPSNVSIPSQPQRTTRVTKKKHPRYSIFAYGCSDTVYRVINRGSRSLYKSLLANRNFLDDHPRQDEESLLAVRRLKPFWTIGEGCYHWFSSAFLRRCETFDDDEGKVIVGAPMEVEDGVEDGEDLDRDEDMEL